MARRAAVQAPALPLDFFAVDGMREAAAEWERYRGGTRHPMTERAWVLFWNMLRDACGGDNRYAPLVVAWSIAKQFQGVFRPKVPWAEAGRLLNMKLPPAREHKAAQRKTPAQLASEAEDELAVLRHAVSPQDFDGYMKLIRNREGRGDSAGLESLIDELRERGRSQEGATLFEGVRAGGPRGAPS